jgi:hypothetical protein
MIRAKKEPDECNLFVFQGGIFQDALKKLERKRNKSGRPLARAPKWGDD